MPHAHFRQKLPVLRLARWFLLALGIALLGCVGYVLLDAKLFQAREQKRLHLEAKPSAQTSAALQPQMLPVTSSTSDQVQRIQVVPGAAFGRIEIRRIGVDVVIVEGIDAKTLRRGAGHIPGSALPGDPGNVAIAGHRDTFFRALRDIRQDDEVTLTTLTGKYLYRVDWTRVVGDGDSQLLSDSDESILTLVTCYPFYFVGPAPKRFVVRAHKI
jgi:sortase A